MPDLQNLQEPGGADKCCAGSVCICQMMQARRRKVLRLPVSFVFYRRDE